MEKNAGTIEYGTQPAYTAQPAYVAQPAYTAGGQPAYVTQQTTYIVQQPGYAAPPPGPTPVQPPYVEPQGCCARNSKNKPQSNSAGAAALVFISGGMNIAWSIGFSPYTGFLIDKHMRLSWFVGAIIGAIFGALLTNRVPKKLLIIFSICLTLVDGVLFLSVSHDYDGVIIARYIDGIANGLVFVPTIVLAGEEAVKSMRGMLSASIESMCLYLGMFLQITYSSSWSSYYSFNVLQMQGTLTLIDGLIGLLIAFALHVESPIFYLQHGQEEMAIDSLRRLQRPFVVTTETYAQLADHKEYIALNDELSFIQSLIQGIPALLKLCFYRAMVSLSFSTFVYMALYITAVSSQGIYYTTWAFIVFGMDFFLGAMFSAFKLDWAGRKKPVIVGSLIAGGVAYGVAAILDSSYNIVYHSTTGLSLLLVFQFFAGYYTTASSAYLSEAFPLRVKSFYIAIAYIVQMVVQIVICSCDTSIQGTADYFYSLGSLTVIFSVFAVLCLPETKQTSLAEAQKKFRRIFTPRLN